MSESKLPQRVRRVVGIGASVSSVGGLQKLCHELPIGQGLAYVVVLRFIAGERNALIDALSSSTTMPVLAAKAGEYVQPDCVYVVMSAEPLALREGRFVEPLLGACEVGPAPVGAIDTFLETLAADQRTCSMAIILSGAGSDGAAGSMQIKRAGGEVLVQAPTAGATEGMPQSVIAMGAADHILPIEDIAAHLMHEPHVSGGRELQNREHVGTTLQGMQKILEAMRQRVSVDLESYKLAPLFRRARLRMAVRRVQRLDDYAALLNDDPDEMDALVSGIPFHVTEFFRDPPAWDALQPSLDALLRSRPSGLRAWVSACSTGEEPYSLAMLLTERTQVLGLPANFRVFATDASERLLERASRGVFTPESLQKLSTERREQFFYGVEGNFRVTRSLRERMVFATQDLLLDPPLQGFDVVFCRNLLIYLTEQAAARVLRGLVSGLHGGGILFLGQTEKYDRSDEVEPVSRAWSVFRKRARAKARVPRLAEARLDPGTSLLPVSEERITGVDELRDDSVQRRPEDWSQDDQAATDALEASREESIALDQELRFINGELQQANTELQQTIHELEMQKRVLGSGAVMTLFLDDRLRVRWFTPALCELFPLLPRDVGRPIDHLTPLFRDTSFLSDAKSVIETECASEKEVWHNDGRWFERCIRPHIGDSTVGPGVAVTFSDITRRKIAEAELNESRACLADQNDAFRAAMNGEPLETALIPLIRTAVAHLGSDVRCAFYLADAQGRELHHVIGMGEAYSRCVDGFKIGADSLACGLAVYTGKPVITPDVLEEPGWRDWTWLSTEFKFRGCWSFPIETTYGKVVGTLAVYHPGPREAQTKDLHLAEMITGAAAIIISRHHEMEKGERASRALAHRHAEQADHRDSGSVNASLARECETPRRSAT